MQKPKFGFCRGNWPARNKIAAVNRGTAVKSIQKGQEKKLWKRNRRDKKNHFLQRIGVFIKRFLG